MSKAPSVAAPAPAKDKNPASSETKPTEASSTKQKLKASGTINFGKAQPKVAVKNEESEVSLKIGGKEKEQGKVNGKEKELGRDNKDKVKTKEKTSEKEKEKEKASEKKGKGEETEVELSKTRGKKAEESGLSKKVDKFRETQKVGSDSYYLYLFVFSLSSQY